MSNGKVKDYEGTIFSQAEKIALEKYSSGTYPKIFPWELNESNESNDVEIVYFHYHVATGLLLENL